MTQYTLGVVRQAWERTRRLSFGGLGAPLGLLGQTKAKGAFSPFSALRTHVPIPGMPSLLGMSPYVYILAGPFPEGGEQGLTSRDSRQWRPQMRTCRGRKLKASRFSREYT